MIVLLIICTFLGTYSQAGGQQQFLLIPAMHSMLCIFVGLCFEQMLTVTYFYYFLASSVVVVICYLFGNGQQLHNMIRILEVNHDLNAINSFLWNYGYIAVQQSNFFYKSFNCFLICIPAHMKVSHNSILYNSYICVKLLNTLHLKFEHCMMVQLLW